MHGLSGRGIDAEFVFGRTSLRVQGTLIEQVHGFGIYLAGVEAEIAGSVVRDTVAASVAEPGRGLWAQEGSCSDTLCTERVRTVPLGPVLLATSIPFLAVPIVAIIERATQSDDEGSASAYVVPAFSTTELGLTAGGTF